MKVTCCQVFLHITGTVYSLAYIYMEQVVTPDQQLNTAVLTLRNVIGVC